MPWRVMRWVLILGILVWAVTAVAVIAMSFRAWSHYGMGRALTEPVDAALVLGGGVDADGMISYSSRRRVWAAVEVLKAGRVDHLIFSGGSGPNNPVPPAERMAAYAERLGGDPDRMSIEPRARSTFENLRFGFEIAREKGFERLAVVTDSHHLTRANALAHYLGRPEIRLVAVPGLELESYAVQTLSILRESMAWWYNLYKVAAWEIMAVFGLDESQRREWIR